MGDTYTDGDNYTNANLSHSINNIRSHVNVYLPADPEDRKRMLDAATARLAQLPTAEDAPIPTPAPLPTPHRMLLPPSATFVGRDAELRQLATALKSGATAVVSAVTGIGGMGKTQLASEFAHRYGTFFLGGVFWLSLADAGGIEAEIAACGGTMQLPAWEALSFADQVQRVRQIWEEPLPRLLIFDNCEDLDLLDRYRPATGGCRVLVTSRRDDWGTARHLPTFPLATLPRAQSIALLRQFRPDLAENAPHLDALAAELGDLPLALHVAGSFLQRYPRLSLADYLTQLRAAPLGTLTQRLERLAAAPTRHDLDVARTFRVSYDRLDASNPIDRLARTLLARAACFAPGEPIPTEVLIQTLPDGTDLRDAEDGLRRLGELGLLEGGGHAWRLHRLLATFVQAAITLLEYQAAQKAVESTLITIAESVNHHARPHDLLCIQPHLYYVTDQALPRKDIQAAQLCQIMGSYLTELANYPSARSYYKHCLIITMHLFGHNHPNTSTSLNNLARLLHMQGEYEQSYKLFTQALTLLEPHLNKHLILIASILNNLGSLLKDQGELTRARSCYERALSIRKHELGPNHRETAQSLGNLAALLSNQGDFTMAHRLYEQALTIHIHLFGEAHLYTANTLNNIATLFQMQGNYARAKEFAERAVKICIQVRGIYHPYTSKTINNLAVILQNLGDIDTALTLYQQSYTIEKHILNPNHPNIATHLQNIAVIFQAQNRFDDAKILYKHALIIRERNKHINHPLTAQLLCNFASLLYTMHDTDTSYKYYIRALDISKKSNGINHPDTARIIMHIADLLKEINNFSCAQKYYDQALTIFEQKLGSHHPDIIYVLNRIADLMYLSGKNREAQKLLYRALSIAKCHLSINHPVTNTIQKNLETLIMEQSPDDQE
ncbi:tetratricopeptide repeat protein [Chloroflexia bacterium SDU3-3]|nr:tetratricopeptide repeat protein [Chloroflexia bacterium SDU3-3]